MELGRRRAGECGQCIKLQCIPLIAVAPSPHNYPLFVNEFFSFPPILPTIYPMHSIRSSARSRNSSMDSLISMQWSVCLLYHVILIQEIDASSASDGLSSLPGLDQLPESSGLSMGREMLQSLASGMPGIDEAMSFSEMMRYPSLVFTVANIILQTHQLSRLRCCRLRYCSHWTHSSTVAIPLCHREGIRQDRISSGIIELPSAYSNYSSVYHRPDVQSVQWTTWYVRHVIGGHNGQIE